MSTLPGRAECCWADLAAPIDRPGLEEERESETVVVGGGIVGLTTALALLKAGRRVIVLEGLRIGGQVTGRSTAKVTTQHALIYRHLIDTFGAERARLYADANRTGVTTILSWAADHDIACDLERKPAYAYSCDAGRRDDLDAEAEAAGSLGLDAEVVERAPLPFNTLGALRFPDQHQFNPARYLVGLSQAIVEAGGEIFEQSRARAIEEGRRWRVETDGGAVEARNVVVATNITIKSPVGYANRTQPRAHAAMAFRADSPVLIDGMFISIDDPTHSLRMGRDRQGPLLIALGPKYNTGQDGDVAARFRELETWTRARFPVGEAVWRWSNEDYDTADRVPYVGEPAPDEAPGFHVATGFNAWGISNGTAAGLLICQRIVKGQSAWDALYDPVRPYPEDFHQSGKSQSVIADVSELAPGQGGVLERGEEMLAVWRDDAGRLHALAGNCTHKGCPLTWNNAERTWDCPCHGSMFSADGSVLHGPARQPLEPRQL